jgi:hypothetical protein
VSSKTV